MVFPFAGDGVSYMLLSTLIECHIRNNREMVRWVMKSPVGSLEPAGVDSDIQRAETVKAYMVRLPPGQSRFILEVLSSGLGDIPEPSGSGIMLEKVEPP